MQLGNGIVVGKALVQVGLDSNVGLSNEGVLEEQVTALMPPLFKGYSGQSFYAVRTCGDGACALHAVFGSLTAGGDCFFSKRSRESSQTFGP